MSISHAAADARGRLPAASAWTSRRDFLATTAGVAAAVSVGRSTTAQPPADGSLLVYGQGGRNRSLAPGDTLPLCVSTRGKSYDLLVERLGASWEVVWEKRGLPGREQPVPADASAQGCRWNVVAEVPIGRDWRSGVYRVTGIPDVPDLHQEKGDGCDRQFHFIVRAKNPGTRSKILLQLSTNTDNAYNNFGGHSLYAFNSTSGLQGRRVSWDRPMHSYCVRIWETPFIAWCERNGFPLEYATNNDLEFQPNICDPYKLVLSVGHDEYWSTPMRDTVEQYAAGGGNVAFFSGNVCCWQIRNEADGFLCHKQFFREDPVYRPNGPNPTLSTLWSHHLLDRPENRMTGVGVLKGGFHGVNGQLMDGSGAFTVERPDHWVFAGTNLARNQEFGGAHTIVGYECDGCEFTRDAAGRPIPACKDGTPEGFEILATAPAQWPAEEFSWYERWPKDQRGHACLGLYRTPGGGTVFTAGTTDWAHGLRQRPKDPLPPDPIVERITRNVLERLAGK